MMHYQPVQDQRSIFKSPTVSIGTQEITPLPTTQSNPKEPGKAPISSHMRRKVLTPKEFYAAIGGTLGIQTIYELLHSGRLRHIRVGTRFKIPYTEVDEFFQREIAEAAR